MWCIFPLAKQGKMAKAIPQSDVLALAEFTGLSCISLSELRDAEIPSAHGLPHQCPALVGASWCRYNTVTDSNKLRGWFIEGGDSTAKPNSLSWLCLQLTHLSFGKTACCLIPAVSMHDGRYSRASIQQCLLQNWEQTSSVQQESRCPVKTAVTSQALQTIILDTNSCTV